MKLFLTLLFAAIGGLIPLTLAYLLWSWCIAQIPVTLAWAGIAKIGITLVMILMGGGITVGLAILGTILAGALANAILD